MRFIKNLYSTILAAAVGVMAFTGCQPEESPLSRAILTSVSGVQFAAQNAEPQTISVYADADWTVEAPEWVTVDKMSGSRSMDVTISVGDNMRDGAIDNPKKDTIVFRGYNLLATAYVIVSQDGDKYRDVPANTISSVLSMKDEDVVILNDVTVAAVSTNGFVVTDGSANLFVVSQNAVTVGDKVNVKGSKGTVNDLAAVTICDGVEVTGNAAVTYPSASDITGAIDTYSSKTMDFVEIKGALNGNEIVVEGAVRFGIVLDATAAAGLDALNGHNVIVRGYFAGATVSVVNVIAAEIVDLGVNDIIYYADNFEWFADIAAAEGAGDAVATNDPGTTAPNVFTMKSKDDFLAAFNERGYKFLWGKVGSTEFTEGPDPAVGDSRVMYLQSNYLKFGKTSWNGAISLPALTEIQGGANVVIEFDWCWQVTGAYKPDIMTLSVDATVGQFAASAASTSEPLESAQSTVDGQSAIEWQHVKIVLNGATPETVLTIRPTYADPDVQNAVRHQNRWYLDNIKITDAGGDVVVTPPAGSKTVFTEDFEWVAPMVETDGAGDAVGTDNASATAPNVWKMTSSADFFAKFNELGYQYLYSTVGSKEYAAGPEQAPKSDVGKEGSLYIQANYLKFGQSSYNGALVLPALSAIDGTADVTIEFDWCWQVTGANKADIMTLSVDATVGQFPATGGPISANLESTQSTVDGESHLAWQHVTIDLNGATAETVLTIRPTSADPAVQNPERKQNRWYLDNIKVVTK